MVIAIILALSRSIRLSGTWLEFRELLESIESNTLIRLSDRASIM